MNTRTEERVDDWSTRPTAAGYDGLRDLADDGFSGAIRARGTWLFMLNGRIVGVFEGEIEDFESASATAYEAPDPSLPLLFTMLEKGGEQQAKYYTEDTPVAEADGTLSSGSFTGYIELSENVLSGDYYVVYYGGRSMKCAFVGNSEDLLTGDEAFERANDEVGIYEVRNVDIEVTDVPNPSGAADDAGDVDSTDKGTDAPANGAGADRGVADEAGSVGGGASTSAEGPASGGATDARRTETHQSNSGGTPSTSDGATPDQQTAATPETVPAEETEPDETAQANGSVADSTPNGGAVDPTHPTERESFGAAGADATDPEPDTETGVEPDVAEVEPQVTESEPEVAEADPDVEDAAASAEPAETPTDAGSETARADAAGSDAAADDSPERESWDTDLGTDEATSADDEQADPDSQSETEWREAQTIPALDPDRTSTGDDGDRSESRERNADNRSSGKASAGGRQTENRGGATGRKGAADQGQSANRGQSGNRGAANGGSTAREPTQQDEALKQEVLEREDKIDQLQQHVSNLQSERDRLRSERDDLAAENESLRDEVEELEGEIQRLEQAVTRLKGEVEDARQAAGGAPNASQRISPVEALQGTNLFVRYASKGDATLSDARAGDADAEAVNANLRLEHHTQFESDDVAVDGQAFDEYLTSTLEFNFVDWVVGGLIYEIRDTGHATALEDLYDAIPEIDRAELKGNVSLVYTENGDEIREQQQFDVVLRDRMGNPLIVADLNDSRQPVTQDGMANLQNSASKVKETSEHLSSAFVVTSSFFEPGALETAAEATSGSFLSRDSKESYVKLGRKQGYHLCLVESRGRDFHLNVPEL